MNQDNDQAKTAAVDPQVSDQYATIAGEQTPAHLDRAVMREAARAVRADNRKGSFGAWFRPVAFMAMLGLSLAIILDFSDMAIFEPVSDTSFEVAPKAREPATSGTDEFDRNPGQPALNELKRQEKLAPAASSFADETDTSKNNATGGPLREAATESAQSDQAQLRKMRRDSLPANSPPPAEPTEDRDRASALTVEAGIVEQRVRDAESAIDATLQSQPDAAAQFSAPLSAVTRESYASVTPVACSDEQKADVEEWWKCVALLRESGLAEAAELEFENLKDTFPDFEPPE